MQEILHVDIELILSTRLLANYISQSALIHQISWADL